MTIETTIGKAELPVIVEYDGGPAIKGNRWEPDESAWADVLKVEVVIGTDRYDIRELLDDDVLDDIAYAICEGMK